MNENTAPVDAGQVDAPVETGQASETPSTWYDTAPDEVKGYIQNKGWDDPLKAVSSYQELEKFRGASEDQLIKFPKDLSEEGALDPIYDRLGRPESFDKYEVSLPEGLPVDEARLNGAKELAHKLGLNNEQLQAIAQYDAEYMAAAHQKAVEEVNQQQTLEYEALKKEWGANYEQREELARRGLKSILPDGVDKEAVTNAIENAAGTATILKMFAKVGELFAEDKVPDNSGDRPSFGYTKEQAIADRRKLMNDIAADPKRLADYNEGKGNDVDKMRRLNKLASE